MPLYYHKSRQDATAPPNMHCLREGMVCHCTLLGGRYREGHGGPGTQHHQGPGRGGGHAPRQASGAGKPVPHRGGGAGSPSTWHHHGLPQHLFTRDGQRVGGSHALRPGRGRGGGCTCGSALPSTTSSAAPSAASTPVAPRSSSPGAWRTSGDSWGYVCSHTS